MSAPLYLFGWPGRVGGSETKLGAVAKLLARDFQITWVPNDRGRLGDRRARGWMGALGMRAASWEDLPGRLSGWGLALCNIAFLTEGRAAEAKLRGLKIAWGGEMMWAIPGELGALAAGLVDLVLYTGEAQRGVLEPGFLAALGGRARGRLERKITAAHPAWGGSSGLLAGRAGTVRWATVGNFVDPAAFPFKVRSQGGAEVLTIGRLSRADWSKYPADFPESYTRLGLPAGTRFRVMAWAPHLRRLWPGRGRFDRQWELLPAMAEEPARFLRSLDLFIYDTHRRFSESWGRALVEAMLTGAVPLIPADARHHLRTLVPDGVAGFHCATRRDWRAKARLLAGDAALRLQMSRAAGEFAREELCAAEQHRAVWRGLFAE